MPNFNETIRVFGDELGESDTYIDATVQGYSLDGQLKLVEDVETNPREWVIPQPNIDQWRREGNVIAHSRMPNPNHKVWAVLEDLRNAANSQGMKHSQSDLTNNVKNLFKQATEAQRRQHEANNQNG